MSTPGPDPLAIPCPKCEAGKDERCYVSRSGRILPRPHRDRIRLAETREKEARRRADGDASHRIEGPRFRRVYANCRLMLEARGDWTDLNAETLEAMVLDMEAAAKARMGARREPLVAGSTTNKVANPLFGVHLRLSASALASARALKLLPETMPAKAPRVAAEDTPPGEDDAPDVEKDPLAVLDDLAADARRRKAGKAGK